MRRQVRSGSAGDSQFLQVIHEHLQADVVGQDRGSRLLQRKLNITTGFISTKSETKSERSQSHLSPGVHVVVGLGGVHFGEQETSLENIIIIIIIIIIIDHHIITLILL